MACLPQQGVQRPPRRAGARQPRHAWLTCLCLCLWLALACSTAQAQLKSGDNPEASPVWLKVRASLFQDRPIAAAQGGLLELDAPQRAIDAATVPMAIRTRLPAGEARRVQRIYLVIDNNPSPVAAVFDWAPGQGQPDMELRVRVDEYSHARAIAELSDGQLVMATRFVKASGGCSAPAGSDQQAALASLGKMQWRVDGPPRNGQPLLVQLMISHPNHSGLAMDQSTRQYTPAHFVRRVAVSYAGKPVLDADLDFAVSENPNLRFHLLPQGDGVLKAEVTDTQERRFESSLRLGAAP